jgi:glycosyltransferase involved in cell wall biosynthesis
MKVLCVVHSPFFGGPHNEALRLMEPLRRRGWEIEVAIPDEPGSAGPRLEAGGVPVHALPLSRLRASPDPRLLLGFARDFRPTVRGVEDVIGATGADVVQIGGLVNPHAALAARRRKAAVVWQIVDSRAPAPLRRAAMPLVRRLADAVMFDGEALIELHGGRESLTMPVFVYFPPVDTGRFVPSAERRSEVRDELGIPADAPVVGTVSSLNPMKGLEYFLDAAVHVAVSRPETWFVVVGGAPASHRAYGERLRTRAAELALPNPVIFAGERADVERWYPAFDVDLITSLPRSEGTTTTALEAQACGVPVVAARVAAVNEVVANGTTGLLVPPERPRAIADAVLRLLGDEALSARMGTAGRKAAIDRFDVERTADVYVQAYDAALAHGAGRGATSRGSNRRSRRS